MGMASMRRFETDGGHIITNFVNTLDERPSARPIERLTSYADLVTFVYQEGRIDDAAFKEMMRRAGDPEADRELRIAIRYREVLHRIVHAIAIGETPSDRDAGQIQRAILQAMNARLLSLAGTHSGWRWREPLELERPRFEIALATCEFFETTDLNRVRQCDATDCGTLFVDRGKSGNRRWCSMATCGNREKARRHRIAQRVRE